MRNYYLEQSHGSFTVGGDIRNWVKLDMPESWYGADSNPGRSPTTSTARSWRVARDAVAKFAAENPDFPWADYDHENPYGISRQGLQPARRLRRPPDPRPRRQRRVGRRRRPASRRHLGALVDICENLSGGPGDGPGYMVPGTDGQGPQGKGIWVYPTPSTPRTATRACSATSSATTSDSPTSTTTPAPPATRTGFWTIMASGSWLGRQWGLGSAPGPMNVWDKAALGFVTRRSSSAAHGDDEAPAGGRPAPPAPPASSSRLPKRKHTVELSGKDGATSGTPAWATTSTPGSTSRTRSTCPRRPHPDVPHLVRHRRRVRLRLRARLRRRRHWTSARARQHGRPQR